MKWRGNGYVVKKIAPTVGTIAHARYTTVRRRWRRNASTAPATPIVSSGSVT